MTTWYFPPFFVLLAGHTQAFSVKGEMLEFKVGMGKTNKCVSWSGSRGSEHWSLQKTGQGLKKSCLYVHPQHNLVYVQSRRRCVFVCVRCIHLGRHRISNLTSFPENIYLIFLSFHAKLTSFIAKIAPNTSWKIPSGLFEIPEWICQGYVVWAMFICFQTVGGIRVVLSQKVFGLSSVTDNQEGALTADGQK